MSGRHGRLIGLLVALALTPPGGKAGEAQGTAPRAQNPRSAQTSKVGESATQESDSAGAVNAKKPASTTDAAAETSEASTEVDDELLEFLGSVDSEADSEFIEYLSRQDNASTAKARAKSSTGAVKQKSTRDP